MTDYELDLAINIEELIINELDRVGNKGPTWENAVMRRNALVSVRAGNRTAQTPANAIGDDN